MAQFLQKCRKIVAVGRNYAKHVAELNNAMPERPLLFLKPPSSFLSSSKNSSPIEIPAECKELHHEVELGIVIGSRAHRIDSKSADRHIAGYVLALDMTARDLQDQAKKKGITVVCFQRVRYIYSSG